jgi:hypothetical protein
VTEDFFIQENGNGKDTEQSTRVFDR